VRRLRPTFFVALGTLRGIVESGEDTESATPHSTSLNSSTYLLVLALAATAVIAVVVVYFVMKCRQTSLVTEGQT